MDEKYNLGLDMFTGIITDVGTIEEIIENDDISFKIQTNYDLSNVAIGASICCSGACLTVVEKGSDWFLVDVSSETISKTNLGSWKKGTLINLERSLKIGDELGGHIVTGHVDGLADVISIETIGASRKLTLGAPDDLKYFIAQKGSVTLNGVSLTVNNVDNNRFDVNIIPHTSEVTTFKNLQNGDKVNIEIDILARYVSRMNSKS